MPQPKKQNLKPRRLENLKKVCQSSRVRKENNMCVECGCNSTAIGKLNDKLTGKPTKSPYGEYEGVGGTK